MVYQGDDEDLLINEIGMYVMNADGSKLTRLTSHPAQDYGPSWSKK